MAWQSAISGPAAVVSTPSVDTPVATPEVALPASYQLYLPTIHQEQAVVAQPLSVTTTLVLSTVVSAEATLTAPSLSTPVTETIPMIANTPEPTSTVVTATVAPTAPTPITPTAEAGGYPHAGRCC